MARLVFLLAVASLFVGSAGAQSDNGLTRRFATANAAYAQERYTQAVEMYEDLLDTGYTNRALYYNLGNAYARLNRLGAAIRYYEKAKRLRPNDPRIAHNLEQVRRRAEVYPERLRQKTGGVQDLVQGWSPMALFVAGGLLLCSGAAVGIVWTRPHRPNGGRHPLVWGLAVAGLLLVAGAMGTSYLQSLDQYAVVVTPEAVLRERPRAEASSDTTLTEGTLLEVRSRTGRWYEVQRTDDVTGWLLTRALGNI